MCVQRILPRRMLHLSHLILLPIRRGKMGRAQDIWSIVGIGRDEDVLRGGFHVQPGVAWSERPFVV